MAGVISGCPGEQASQRPQETAGGTPESPPGAGMWYACPHLQLALVEDSPGYCGPRKRAHSVRMRAASREPLDLKPRYKV